MYNTAIDYKLKYTYANGVEMCESGGTSLRFEGTEGWVGNCGWARPPEASSHPKLSHRSVRPSSSLVVKVNTETSRLRQVSQDPYLPAEPDIA